MIGMNIRPGGGSSLQLAYAVGRIEGEDDAFVINQLGGDSPLGSVLCSLGTDYAVRVNPDGSGRSMLAGLDVTSPRGDGKGWYIKDSISGEVWSPFFLPTRQCVDEYEVGYLPGQVTVYSLKHKIACFLTIATVPGKSCELWRVRIENRSASDRSLTFTTYAEPGMGPELESGYMDKHKALLMGRPLSALDDDPPMQDTVVFHSSTLTPIRFHTEKQSFVGEGRSLHNPVYLDTDEHFGEDGTTKHAAASLTVEVELPIEGEADFGFCFGVAPSPEQALQIVRAYSRPANITAAIEASIGCWQDLSAGTVLRSRDRAANALVNTWLPYEAYAAWLGQRTGGVCLDPTCAADALRRMYALTAAAPDQCRESLLQFAGGVSVAGSYSPDSESIVMVPPGEMMWLPACTAHYVAETGDMDVLSERVGLNEQSQLTLKEHCERIIRLCTSSDGGNASSLVARTVKSWALIDASSVEFAALRDAMAKREAGETDDPPEQRSLPRRVRFFQSLTPVLSEGEAARDLERLFGSELGPTGDSGAACCTYATLVERVLGLEATPQGLRIHPDLPPAWQECEITRRFRDDVYLISVRRSLQPRKSGISVVVDGEPMLGDMLPYLGDGMEHRVEVVLG